MEINYFISDVFTDKLFNGAQIAVIPEAQGLSESQMQSIAVELNLSETVFVSPDANHAFQIRTFSPREEISFASHTTVAAAFVLAQNKLIDLSQGDCKVDFNFSNTSAEVEVFQKNGLFSSTRISLNSEPVVDNFVPDNASLAEIIAMPATCIGQQDCHPLLVANNGIYLVVPVNDLDTVKAARFDPIAWEQSDLPQTQAQCILLFTSETESEQANYHLRLLGPQIAHHEDPPVGASIPAFSAYLASYAHIVKHNTEFSYRAERGLQHKRQSLLDVVIDAMPTRLALQTSTAMHLRIGGQAVMAGRGQLCLPD
ncbi:MAG: PhzF family phenazine biosynthesis protein [Pseudomonadales bacterium]|nr:PhzF family phenazine biosynthesis protein [Pseudomonadales bacterium]